MSELGWWIRNGAIGAAIGVTPFVGVLAVLLVERIAGGRK